MSKQQQQQQQQQEVKENALRCDYGMVGNDMLEFMRRMNRRYVNKDGTMYLEFNFQGTVLSGGPGKREFLDNVVRYYDKSWHCTDPFIRGSNSEDDPYTQVNSLVNVSPPALIDGQVTLPTVFPGAYTAYATTKIFDDLGYQCAFVYNSYCFVGTINRVTDNFYSETAVQNFFKYQYSALGLGKNCFVDKDGSTFFVLTDTSNWWVNTDHVVPSIA